MSKNRNDINTASAEGMPMQQDATAEIIQENPSCGEMMVDFAYTFSDPRLGNLFFIFGWQNLAPGLRLIALDENNANPCLLKPVFWRRHDVEELYGLCTNPEQSGHGFACAFRLPGNRASVVNIFAAFGNQINPINAIRPKRVDTLGQMLHEIMRLPFPAGALERTLEEIAPILYDYTQLEKNQLQSLPIQSGQLGEKVTEPLASLIVRAGQDLEALFTQALCLSEDRELVEKMEVIYVLGNSGNRVEFLKTMESIHTLTGLPLSYLICPGRQGIGYYNNKGAEYARGKYLLFMRGDVCPAEPGFCQRMLKQLLKHQDWGSVAYALAAPGGYLVDPRIIFHYEPATQSFARGYPLRGLGPMDMPPTTPLEASALDSNCLMVRQEDFKKCGGFNTAWQTNEFSEWEFARQLNKLDRRNMFIPEINAHLVANENINDVLPLLYHLQEKSKFQQLWAGELKAVNGTL